MDSASSGFEIFQILAAILGLFIAIVWLIFPFIVMNRMRGIREEIEKSNEILSKIVNGFERAETTAPTPRAVPTPRVVSRLHISKGENDLGEMDIAMVKTMVNGGQLTLQDHYFDAELKEWVTLESHPDFC